MAGLIGQLILFPRVFAVANSKEGHSRSCHVDSFGEYKPDHRGGAIHVADHRRTLIEGKEEPWGYLLRTQKPGRLCCVVRGKELVIAAGQHAVRINFGLEGHLIEMTPEHFKAILDHNDERHANPKEWEIGHPASFAIPPELCVSFSSPQKDRTINMFCAFKTSGKVFALVDHSRLLILHVMSRAASWTSDDLSPGSQVISFF